MTKDDDRGKKVRGGTDGFNGIVWMQKSPLILVHVDHHGTWIELHGRDWVVAPCFTATCPAPLQRSRCRWKDSDLDEQRPLDLELFICRAAGPSHPDMTMCNQRLTGELVMARGSWEALSLTFSDAPWAVTHSIIPYTSYYLVYPQRWCEDDLGQTAKPGVSLTTAASGQLHVSFRLEFLGFKWNRQGFGDVSPCDCKCPFKPRGRCEPRAQSHSSMPRLRSSPSCCSCAKPIVASLLVPSQLPLACL